MSAAAQEISRHGYANMVLERVASDAGYTRGALYHLFASKEELAFAVINWVSRSWYEDVGYLFAKGTDPVQTLIAVARETSVHFRDGSGRVLTRLRIEFDGTDNAIGQAAESVYARVADDTARLIESGRQTGTIPPGPPARVVALAFLGSLEGIVHQLAGQAPYDAVLAESAVRGVLGLAPAPDSTGTG